MPEKVPQEFYDLVDRFIKVANDLARKHNTTRISAIIMFAAARYNAHCLLAQDPEAGDERDEAMNYFVEQYRIMLKENIDWLTRLRSQE
jgi:hypothetical protein